MSAKSDSINRERCKDAKGHNEVLKRDTKEDRLKPIKKSFKKKVLRHSYRTQQIKQCALIFDRSLRKFIMMPIGVNGKFFEDTQRSCEVANKVATSSYKGEMEEPEETLTEPKEPIVPRKFTYEDMEELYEELNILSINAKVYSRDTLISDASLSELGLRVLGSGFFSKAYEIIGTNFVVKIGNRLEDAYSAYVAYCRQHRGEEGIPNIYFTKQLQNGMLVTFLDRLYGEFKEDWGYNPNDVMCFINDRVDRAGIKTKGYGCCAIPHIFRQNYRGDWKALEKTIDNILEYFKDIARIDLHKGNFMVTENGNVVITDPVSYTKDKIYRKSKDSLSILRV